MTTPAYESLAKKFLVGSDKDHVYVTSPAPVSPTKTLTKEEARELAIQLLSAAR